MSPRRPASERTTPIPQHAPGQPAISIDRLSLSYRRRDREHVRVLHELDLQVAEGELVVVLGPSGCGKSSLLRCICGLVEPTAGEVRVLGVAPELARRRRWLTLLDQKPRLLPNRCSARNVSLPLELMGVKDPDRVDEVLELVNLSDAANAYPHELSLGMRQRLAFARALVTRPRVMLLDEPYSALDEILRERLAAEFLLLQRELGQAIVFVTHSIEESAFLGDRIVLLSDRPASVSHVVVSEFTADRTPEIRLTDDYFLMTREIRRLLQP